jgi:hypothetical protein
MSNRLTKGTAAVGYLASDRPGLKYGPAVRVSAPASTAQVVSAFKFPDTAVVENVYVHVLSIGATSGWVNVGLSSAASSSISNGFLAALPIGSVGTKIATASSSDAAPTYGILLLNAYSTIIGLSMLQPYAIGVASTGATQSANFRYLSYSVDGSTGLSTLSLIITPVYYELGS